MRDAVPPGKTTGGGGTPEPPAVAQSVPDDADTQSSPDTQPRPGPRARHLTREHVCQGYVLVGRPAISRVR